jgi:hypothetical protein
MNYYYSFKTSEMLKALKFLTDVVPRDGFRGALTTRLLVDICFSDFAKH